MNHPNHIRDAISFVLPGFLWKRTRIHNGNIMDVIPVARCNPLQQMHPWIQKTGLFGMLLLALSCQQAFPIEESSFSKALVPGTYIIPAAEGNWNWCMAPIYDEKGKLHVFNSIIPNKGSWIKNSKIAHYTADKPEGPYAFKGFAFASDEATYHNPQISKVGDTYVLVFMINRYQQNGSKQEVGIATAKSLDGHWTESPLNPVIPASGKMGGANINHASNPTFVAAPDVKFRIYYKSMTDKYGKSRYREISLAVSDHIEGPYVNYAGNPLISYADRQCDIEDPYAFYYQGMYYMIVEDRTGVQNLLDGTKRVGGPGGCRPGLIYQSKDGINWGGRKLVIKQTKSILGRNWRGVNAPTSYGRTGNRNASSSPVSMTIRLRGIS